MIRNTIIQKLHHQKHIPQIHKTTVHSRRKAGTTLRPFAPLGAKQNAGNPKD
ncbi:hypothetical protein [Mucilaginibacter gracilis]|uniref:hypothetical protein n=1 Tax=Mucilaginibacter gracilis TaxID=423350 RepID=UPI0013C2ACE6|nr:hypothetical protein [Mucilaginibacter gracilis]